MNGPMVEGDRPAAFLDRDGVLNELVYRDSGAASPRIIDDFKIRPGAVEAVRALRDLGLPVLVVSNQPDIERGWMTRASLAQMSAVLRAAVPIDDMAICEHDDCNGCRCRKPKPGLLVELAERWGIDLKRSFMIGDSWRDVGAGRAAACFTILVGVSDARGGVPDAVVEDLAGAVAAVRRRLQSGSAELG